MMSLLGKKKQRIGELFVEQGLINTNQLKDALKRQAQVGGHLGSILVELGFVDIDTMLSFLSKQVGIPSVNLSKIDILPEVLKIMPLEKIKAMKILPITVNENSITLAMVNPKDMIAIRDIEFSLGKKVNPVVVLASQMEMVIKTLSEHPGDGISGSNLSKIGIKTDLRKAPSLINLLKYLSSSPASDLMLTAGVPPSIKFGNDVKRADMNALTPDDCIRYAKEILNEKNWEIFQEKGDFDIAKTYPEIGRFRINLYKQRNSISITMRYIKDILPSMEELNLPEWIKEYVLAPQGLILVSGPAGHGKTTTLNTIVDIINSTRRCNIITFEEPIEYLHKHKKSNVNQREIGTDTQSFIEGMKHVYRQDPDVIVIGDLRDAESFNLTLQAADTGHLVIASVHASNSLTTIERIVNMFPPHQQVFIRTRLADNLIFIFSQKLIPLKSGEGRILAYESIINSTGIKNLIREGKTHQIRSQKTSIGTEDFTPLEISLAKLYKSGLITLEDGLLYAENKQFFNDLTKTS